MEKFVDPNCFLVTKTNTKGVITYANKYFCNIVACSEKDVLHKPHNIIRHPDMPRIIFKLLWDTIPKQQEMLAYVKNKTFDGHFYWVFATATASIDEQGNTIGYYSVRRAPNKKALEIVIPLYTRLLETEKRGGMDASRRLLEETLATQNCSYDQWVNQLQRL
ncbi:signal transduction histidine kinase [Helicobacter sp. NHP19-003]|uniref:Signal transduction histidine kinase n=1 Tax=Helicobacter gastrocanis TaxID=2849641 RepID=A0ABN6I5J6_9HELI|nr:PAS domain-containing protein [Helicobacter sp. NHP19-003]BCZ17879.1 signal transduction histidine kinase [Helicobacter sp. NHP19-003]